MKRPGRTVAVPVAIVAIALLAVAIPVLGADPSGAPSRKPAQEASAKPDASPAPTRSAKPEKNPNTATDKEAKEPEVDVTVTGTVTKGTDGKWPSYTLTAGGTTWELSAGPPWYWGDANPLDPYTGKTVTLVGEHRQGDTELDVKTVDGKAIRADGKPPWAGGPWVVGPKHPGWKDWMAGGKPGHGHGKDKDGAAPAPSPARPG